MHAREPREHRTYACSTHRAHTTRLPASNVDVDVPVQNGHIILAPQPTGTLFEWGQVSGNNHWLQLPFALPGREWIDRSHSGYAVKRAVTGNSLGLDQTWRQCRQWVHIFSLAHSIDNSVLPHWIDWATWLGVSPTCAMNALLTS